LRLRLEEHSLQPRALSAFHVRANVVNEQNSRRGDGQLFNQPVIDGLIRLYQPQVAGVHLHVEERQASRNSAASASIELL